MVQLMLLRHAKSDWSDESLDDFQRPLNARGRRSAPQIADWIDHHRNHPDTILCSPARRTRETLDRILERWQESKISERPAPQIHFIDRLYLAPPQVILETAVEYAKDAQSLMVLGHNPGLEILATQLSQHACEMPTAALVIFQAEPSWPDDWWDSSRWEMQAKVVPER